MAEARSAPAALAAATAFNPEDDADRNASAMAAAAAACRDGGLSRTTGGDWAGTAGGEEVIGGSDAAAAMLAVAGRMGAQGADLLTVIVGEGVGPADTQAVANALRGAFPAATVDVVDGGQRCSAFLIGVE